MPSWFGYVKDRVKNGVSGAYDYVWTDATSKKDVAWRLVKSPFRLALTVAFATGRMDMFILLPLGVSAFFSNYYTTVDVTTTSNYQMALNGITGTGMIAARASTVASSYDAALKWIDKAIIKYKKRDHANPNPHLLKKKYETQLLNQYPVDTVEPFRSQNLDPSPSIESEPAKITSLQLVGT